MTEIFKDIKGYEGLYQVSNLGNVKSLPKGDGNGNRERLLKQEVIRRNHTNYRRVTLSKGGVVKRFQVHRLVALAFIPNPTSLPHINHINNNGEDNRTNNLEWCTPVTNMAHSANQGRQDIARYLGGKANGEIKKAQALASNQTKVGQTIGQLTIVACAIDNSLKSPRITFTCVCSCGNTFNRLSHNLFNKTRPKMCKECFLKTKKMKI